MNLSWLEDFLALAASRNFSRAAQDRHMTQPAFSRRIRALEAWLDVTLFDRTTQPVALTETGEWFRGTAEEILGRVARVPDEARAVAAAGAATLRFAATHALSLTFLPQWLRGLEARVQTGPVHLVSDMLQQCEAALLQGRVQFLLCHAHAQVPGHLDAGAYCSVQVDTDRLLPVCAPDQEGRPRYPLRAGAGTPVAMLAYSAESGLGRLVSGLLGARLAQAGAEPVFTAHLAAVLKSMALDGRGVAWLPCRLVATELDAHRLVMAGDDTWQVAAEIRLFRSAATLSPAAEAFWREVQPVPGALN